MTTKNKHGEVMDIHPEAVKLLNKHRGTDFRPGGEHYVENLTATNAISEALNERDTLRAQVAVMREALREALERELSGVETDIRWSENNELGALIVRHDCIKSALSTLKDQSNDH